MLTVAGVTFTDTDLWNLKQALAAAQAPVATPVPTPQPAPTPVPPPAGGRVINIKLAWGPLRSGNVMAYTANYGGFKGSDVVVVEFTTPPVFSNGQIGAIQVGEFRSDGISRTLCLSRSPGVFDDNSLAPTGMWAQKAYAAANTATVGFVVGGQPAMYPVLQPNTTYYANVKNTLGRGGDIKIELIKPPGL